MPNSFQMPIGLDEYPDLVAGLFMSQVFEKYLQLLEKNDEPEPLSEETKLLYSTKAIRIVAETFPLTIRDRFLEAAESMAAGLIGAKVVFPKRSP